MTPRVLLPLEARRPGIASFLPKTRRTQVTIALSLLLKPSELKSQGNQVVWKLSKGRLSEGTGGSTAHWLVILAMILLNC